MKWRFWGKAIQEDKGVFIPASRLSLGEAPSPTFAKLRDYYLKDPAVMAAVDYIAEMAVGSGFYTTAKTQSAKELVDDFCEEVGLDQILMVVAKELVWAGNSILEKITPTKLANLKVLPLTTFTKVKRDLYGRVQAYVQSVQGKTIEFAPREVIHFKLNVVNGSAWGTGILNSLAETYVLDEGNVRPPLLDVKAQIETDLPKIIHRYGSPKIIWFFENASDDAVKEYAEAIKNAPVDVDFVTNKAVSTQSLSIDPRMRFAEAIEYVENQVIAGLQSPIIKLYTTPGFTEASATVAKEVSEKKIEYLQRYMKRVVEREIFRPVVEQAGMDWKRADLRLHWGMIQEPEIKLEDLMKAYELGAIRTEEIRKNLIDLGWKLWEAEPQPQKTLPSQNGEAEGK